MEIKKSYNLKYRPDQFSTLAAAKRWADRCEKPHQVILGDNGKYWVVCPADAAKLQKAGLEYAQ